ncbi:MAG: class I SAM-dependent methyltransferase [Acidobacteria bacterium]|nr:class I SAM-dependent methyltransferase [Acidobacteriota bacterium]
MATTPSERDFIPALRFHRLTNLYDSLLRFTLPEDAIKRRLVAQADIQPDHRVLDLGCGTGTLTLLIKQAVPEATISGLDADPRALDLAKAKAAKLGMDLRFVRGLAQDAPFEPQSFDRVLSSLMLHHLPPLAKAEALRSAWSLLRPGGELHIVDWTKAQNLPMRLAFLSVQFLDGFESTEDHVRGLLPTAIRKAGFLAVEETHRVATVYGSLGLFKALKGGLGI